jgi:hypothetical protein
MRRRIKSRWSRPVVRASSTRMAMASSIPDSLSWRSFGRRVSTVAIRHLP